MRTSFSSAIAFIEENNGFIATIGPLSPPALYSYEITYGHFFGAIWNNMEKGSLLMNSTALLAWGLCINYLLFCELCIQSMFF